MGGVGRTLLVYLHPVGGGLATGLAAYVASLGLRARRPYAGAAAARRRHAAIAPWMYAFVVVNWIAGVVTTWTLRPELDVTTSGHFMVGCFICALLTAGALLSRRIRIDAWARTIHPLLGATALLLCGVQVFLGLQLTP